MSLWTGHILCFSCGKEFIVNRLAPMEINAALTLFQCPHCLKTPDRTKPHRVNYISSANRPFRKTDRAEVWHFCKYCSSWPDDKFIEIDFRPLGEFCNECTVLAVS
jgi:DNA-directed RNA polymerase subunit RPC12/RpoP